MLTGSAPRGGVHGYTPHHSSHRVAPTLPQGCGAAFPGWRCPKTTTAGGQFRQGLRLAQLRNSGDLSQRRVLPRQTPQ